MKIGNIANLKISTTPRIKMNKFYISKSKDNFSTDLTDYIKNEDKIILENLNNNINLTQFNNSKKNFFFNYNYNSQKEINNLIQNDNSLNINDSSLEALREGSCSSNDFKISKMLFPRKNKNNLSLSLNLLNYTNNKSSSLSKSENEEEKEEKIDTNIISEKKINNIYPLGIYRKENKKLFNFLTEANFIYCRNKKSCKKFNTKNLSSRNDLNKKFCIKNKSYNTPNKIILKINRINEKIKLLDKENIGKYSYIKVNKKNTDLYNELDLKDINKNKSISINDERSSIKINKKNTNSLNIERLKKIKTPKIINYNININSCNNKNRYKEEKFDINKIENNIFLDKEYQNRFKNKSKKNIITNNIFTIEKQKEYNTIIVKKKSNYINNLVNINSTISTSNSSNNKNNKDSKNWVQRLYNDEMEKQKIKNKIIYSLRKSILSADLPNRKRKRINKSKSKKEFKFKNYIKNDKFNFDEKLSIISLFLSDDKRAKNKRTKKYNNFYNRQNTERHSYDENNQFSESDSENNSEEEKPFKNIIRSNSNHKRNNNKFLFLYNEELIHEEDEEKEKDEDEK